MASTSRAVAVVYVVDDDPNVVRSLMRLFRSEDRVVEGFTSAEAFLDLHPRPRRGCLVLDVRMPGMSGPALQLFGPGS